MTMAETHSSGAALSKTRAIEILRRATIAIQLLLLALLVVGRAYSVIGDTHLSRTGAISVAPSQVLSP